MWCFTRSSMVMGPGFCSTFLTGAAAAQGSGAGLLAWSGGEGGGRVPVATLSHPSGQVRHTLKEGPTQGYAGWAGRPHHGPWAGRGQGVGPHQVGGADGPEEDDEGGVPGWRRRPTLGLWRRVVRAPGCQVGLARRLAKPPTLAR